MQTPISPPTESVFDYTNQAWLTRVGDETIFRYVRCGHQDCIADMHGPVKDLDKLKAQLSNSCYGTRHIGEAGDPKAEIH